MINQLKQQNSNDNQKHNKEIKTYIEKIESMNKQIQELSSENNILKNENKNNNSQNNSDEMLKLYKKIEDLNEKLSRYPFILEKGEKILSVIFASASITYSIVCKNTDTIHNLEPELYEKFPELSETNNNFLWGGGAANRFKKFEELKFKNGDMILINQNEF